MHCAHYRHLVWIEWPRVCVGRVHLSFAAVPDGGIVARSHVRLSCAECELNNYGTARRSKTRMWGWDGTTSSRRWRAAGRLSSVRRSGETDASEGSSGGARERGAGMDEMGVGSVGGRTEESDGM